MHRRGRECGGSESPSCLSKAQRLAAPGLGGIGRALACPHGCCGGNTLALEPHGGRGAPPTGRPDRPISPASPLGPVGPASPGSPLAPLGPYEPQEQGVGETQQACSLPPPQGASPELTPDQARLPPPLLHPGSLALTQMMNALRGLDEDRHAGATSVGRGGGSEAGQPL